MRLIRHRATVMFPALKQNIGFEKLKDDHEVETALTLCLTSPDRK